MEHQSPILTLSSDTVPVPLADWLAVHESEALLVSVERLADGRLVLQALPEVDPRLVAQVRRVMAQHADVLRRLT